MTTSTRHKWPDELRREVSPQRTLRECPRCGMLQISRHESEGARDLHWKEFWLGTERVDVGELAGKTPPCDARLEVEA